MEYVIGLFKKGGFNTPEGVEGFSRPSSSGSGRTFPCSSSFNTPEGVEGFSRGDYGDDIEFVGQKSFNTPEGVEGFSKYLQRWAQDPSLEFQYPGGC